MTFKISEPVPPKVFVSHASEDKERFVLSFAAALRAQGVDAWLDKWEMLPGDSLVDKIFEEGLKDASAVIVVLSTHSVDKPWVREELNAAAVKRINTGSKLIPLVIDDCVVPEVLRSTVWERISDLANYQDNLSRIVSAIFGVTEKPVLGPAPNHVNALVKSVNGLSKLDSYVLKLACDLAVSTGFDFIDPEVAFSSGDKLLVPEAELEEVLEILEQQGFIEIAHVLGGGLMHFRITLSGFDAYANTYVGDYQKTVRDVALCIVNKDLTDNLAVAAELNQPRMIVDHIFDVLESNGHIKLSKLIGELTQIYQVGPSLKRALRA